MYQSSRSANGFPMLDLDKIITNSFEMLSDILGDLKEGEIMPPLVMFFKSGGLGILPATQLARAGDHWREVIISIVKDMHETMELDAYVIGVETYGLFYPTEADMAAIQAGRSLKDIPGHQEILAITAGDTSHTVSRFWSLKRDPQTRKYVEFIENTPPEGIDLMGQFTDLLIDKPTLH